MTNTEINKKLAVLLFGLKESDIITRYDGVLFKKDVSYPCGAGPLPDYCGTWEGLGKVVEAMRKRGYNFDINNHVREGDWTSTASKSGFIVAGETAPTAPMDVALAAISALEAEQE